MNIKNKNKNSKYIILEQDLINKEKESSERHTGKKVKNSNYWNIFLLVITAIAFFFFGKNYNSNIMTGLENKNEVYENADFSFYKKAWEELDEKHVAPYEDADIKLPTAQDKVWWSIRGLAGSYNDPYTDFFPPVDNKEFKEDVDSEFFGVGMRVEKIDGFFTIISPLPGTPSARAGLKPKDIILKIDKKEISKLSAEDSVKLIRGPKGTKVVLTIYRKGKDKPFDVEVVRDLIKVPTVETKIVKGVAIIAVHSFGPETVKEFKKELEKFLKSKINKKDRLIIDLRLNPGGYMIASLKMASFFVEGNKFILEEKGKISEYSRKHYSEKALNVFNDDLKIVVLVDEGSASASEIFAGILSDYKKAIIVGKKSFGKGSVQELVDFTKDTSLKMTVAKWFLPSGASVSKVGIIPDVEVEYKNDESQKEYDADRDTQILKAIDVLEKKDFFDIRNSKKTEKEKQEEIVLKKENKDLEDNDKEDDSK